MSTEFFTDPEYLSAAETGARGELTMASMERRIIVAATVHADTLGLGYESLLEDGNAWVLSRMSIEMEQMPRIHSSFRILTWVESINRHLSWRNFSMLAPDGSAMGHARSLWTCINIASRRPATVKFTPGMIADRPCPIEPQPRLAAVDAPERTMFHTFTYSDIDFNGHVNSARYVELIDNAFPLEFHLENRMRRLDIAYLREAPYGATARLALARCENNPLSFNIDILSSGSEATPHCRARAIFEPCKPSGLI